MNCKPGDVAMFTRDAAGYCNGMEFTVPRGTFVYIVRLSIRGSLRARCAHWKVEPFGVRSVCGRFSATAAGVDDSVLKPIRPGDGEDEVLRIAGKPKRLAKPITEAA
jgi:hypothetical protein